MSKRLVLGTAATVLVAAVSGFILEARAEDDLTAVDVYTLVAPTLTLTFVRNLDCGNIIAAARDCKNVTSGQLTVISNDPWYVRLEDNTSFVENTVTVTDGSEAFDFELFHDVSEPGAPTGLFEATVNVTGGNSTWDFDDPPGTYVGTILVTVSTDPI